MSDVSNAEMLAIVRRAYAKQILANAVVEDDPRLEQAFATVARERFLGPTPWYIKPLFGPRRTLPVTEPVVVYQDVLVALAPERGVNNGQPSLHAAWLHAARLNPGSRVAHVGAGAGYYTAIIAELVGPEGHVTAVEFDGTLAAMAAASLSGYANVEVIEGDGSSWPRQPVDCVYVNFGVERPADAWIEQLAPGGRLLFPLGVPQSKPSSGGGTHARHGAGLRVRKVEKGLAVQWLGPAYFVWAEGSHGAAADERAALAAAFEGGGIEFVRSLRWHKPGDPGRSWFIGTGWSLGYEEVPAE